ncbi:MAG: hypothetical protein K1Y01_12665 [Vicinamibacteria bacterium]|nr:hypothetical protein [Vicinamibacteria bacterium]
MTGTWHDYDSLAEQSLEYTNACIKRLETVFGVGHQERFDIDLLGGTLTFSSGGTPRVLAACRPAGSLSHTSNTWLWAWANFNLPPRMRGVSKKARLVGKKESYPRLVEPKWPAEEDDAWEVTAILTYLAKADGAYRCPTKKGDWFVVLSEVTHVAG